MDDVLRALQPGVMGYIVVRRPRRGLHWLRHVRLDRWAYRTEAYPVTVTRNDTP